MVVGGLVFGKGLVWLLDIYLFFGLGVVCLFLGF